MSRRLLIVLAVVGAAFSWAAANRGRLMAADTPSDFSLPPVRVSPGDALAVNSSEHWAFRQVSGDAASSRDSGRRSATGRFETNAAGSWFRRENVISVLPDTGRLELLRPVEDVVLHFDFLLTPGSTSVIEGRADPVSIVLDETWAIQLSDSFGDHAMDHQRTCGAIRGIAAPMVNACEPPGKWQELEVAVKRSGPDSAVITAWLNGKKIHDRVEVTRSNAPPTEINALDAASSSERGASGGGRLTLTSGSATVYIANAWLRPLAEVDHRELIRALDASAFRAGREMYETICVVCHGNLEREGSLPTSRKFWEAEFKNGGDPYAMYQTLANGFDQMPQFAFLTPSQRYAVVHYVREALVKPNNPGQYFEVTENYLRNLPRGLSSEGELSDAMADFAKGPPYLRMNFGPALAWTYQVEPGNIAYKGVAVRLDDGPGGVSRGRAWMIYDHDTLRVAAAWTGEGFIDWKGIAFDGSHGTHSSIVGEIAFANPVGPGWADPDTGSWGDTRYRGRDGRPYGPLPREWVQYHGHYLYGSRVTFSYSVGGVSVLETPGYEERDGFGVFTRTLNIAPSRKTLELRVAPDSAGVALAGPPDATLSVIRQSGFRVLRLLPSAEPRRFKMLIARQPSNELLTAAMTTAPAEDLAPYTRGGPPAQEQAIVTDGVLGTGEAAYQVDELTLPREQENPWKSWLRLSGLDFANGGDRLFVCTWMGEVWQVDGIASDLAELRWRRVANGLFQPLGLLVLGDRLLVTCRDQIVELHDLNGDGEVDWYRCFNNDHQVTEHFHEFAMGLQADAEGNLYYAKSARHALPALVEQHGTLLKVRADGSATEIIANGFRAANGVCVNEDGTFIVTDQEGHWIPKNRINWVSPGGFYGNMMGYHNRTSTADADMEQPLVWITNEMDRSPGELVWVRSGGRFGPLEGSLLNLSYGTGRIFIVPHEKVSGRMQGGVTQLPIPDFPTGVMRGRFHPDNGQLYACGMFAWAGNQQEPGGLYRVRYAGGQVHVPVQLNARENGIRIGFTDPVDRAIAENRSRYRVKVWSLKRSADYGSKHYNERELEVESVEASADGRSVLLKIPNLKPTWCMEIRCDLTTEPGRPVIRTIHNTIHALAPAN